MTPRFLSILAGEAPPRPSDVAFVSALFGLMRARLVAPSAAAAVPWLELLAGVRTSVDLSEASVREAAPAFGADPRIRQVRIALARPEPAPSSAEELVRRVRGDGERPPIVLLAGASVLSRPPEAWAFLERWPRVFLNVMSEPHAAVQPGAEQLAAFREVLGERLFVSLPALAAAADDEAAGPCPARLGLHITLDARAGAVRVCDCAEAPSARLDSGRDWLSWWAARVRELADGACAACAGCPLWERCKGGCFTPRADGILRDRYCPWPERAFGVRP